MNLFFFIFTICDYEDIYFCKLIMNAIEKEPDVCKEQVFRQIFQAVSRDLYNFLYYKYGENNHPEDIVQAAFEKLWKNCIQVLPEKAKSYVFTVANNEMLNSISRQKTVLSYKQQKPKDYTIETPEYLMEEKEYMDRLQEALESLTEDQRSTFLMNRVEGKTHQEIADLLGISRKAVEKRIYTSLHLLREKLKTEKI